MNAVTSLAIGLTAPSVAPAQTTTRVNVTTGGAQAEYGSWHHAISGDGRYVSFTSHATNLVAGDTNGRSDVFVHDRLTGVTSRVNVPAWMDQANDHSFTPRLSADGRIVAFVSGAINMTIGDTNNTWDVFAYDRLTRTTTRVSVGAGGLQSNTRSGGPPDFCPPVMQWDQRGVGKNAATTDRDALVQSLSNDRIVEDAVEMLAWVRTRLKKDKVVVMGYSYGTRVGMAVAQRRPEWVSAYVGVGQGSDSGEDYLYKRLLARRKGRQ